MGSPQDITALKALQMTMNNAFENHFKLAKAQDVKGTIDSRDQLIGLSQVLLGTLAGPMGAVLNMTGSPLQFMAVRMAIDWNVFTSAASKPITVESIATSTGANPSLVARILRLVGAIGWLQQTGPSEWSATPVTMIMTQPGVRDWVKSHWDVMLGLIGAFPDWAKKRDWKTTWVDEQDNVQTEVLGSDCWTWFEKNPEQSAVFDSAMGVVEGFPPEMIPVYPWGDAVKDLDPQGITLVDLGGGRGQAIGRLKAQHPELVGRFICQDLKKTIDEVPANLPKEIGFEPMVHDFFTEQTIKGARFYTMRRILHDWSDAQSLKILKALRPAMLESRDRSRLLLEEFVLPEMDCIPHEAVIDLLMMAVADGKERTRSQWDALLGEAGFRIVKVWPALHMSAAIIEAEVA